MLCEEAVVGVAEDVLSREKAISQQIVLDTTRSILFELTQGWEASISGKKSSLGDRGQWSCLMITL